MCRSRFLLVNVILISEISSNVSGCNCIKFTNNSEAFPNIVFVNFQNYGRPTKILL